MRAFIRPTLIVYSTGDVPATAKNAARTAAATAGSRVQPCEGAPHGSFLTDPTRFNRDLLGFVRGV